MDASRKANRADHEITLQYQSPQEALLVEQLAEDKLTQLLESIEKLKQSPAETAELQRRITLFGECQRIEGETSVQFYPRLQNWLDRYLPSTKSPLHSPRQADSYRTTDETKSI